MDGMGPKPMGQALQKPADRPPQQYVFGRRQHTQVEKPVGHFFTIIRRGRFSGPSRCWSRLTLFQVLPSAVRD